MNPYLIASLITAGVMLLLSAWLTLLYLVTVDTNLAAAFLIGMMACSIVLCAAFATRRGE